MSTMMSQIRPHFIYNTLGSIGQLCELDPPKAGELVHVIADAHIYDRHIPLVKEVLAKPRHSAPKLIVDTSITNFYDFTVDSFKLVDYEYEKLETKIPVAI